MTDPLTPEEQAVTIAQAARLLRFWAGDRQRRNGRWTTEEQAAVDCAMKLEQISAAHERLAQEHTRYKVALKSIATNTCCAGCQEAAKVAAAALAEEPAMNETPCPKCDGSFGEPRYCNGRQIHCSHQSDWVFAAGRHRLEHLVFICERCGFVDLRPTRAETSRPA